MSKCPGVISCPTISSASLADEVFNRNLEVGLLVKNRGLLASAKNNFESFIALGTLAAVTNY